MFPSIKTGKSALCVNEPLGTDCCIRIIATAVRAQHPDGGFGGGPGQFSHSATSYAMILALVHAGGEEALKVIDRRKM